MFRDAPGERYAASTMLIVAGGRIKVFTVLFLSIGLVALFALALIIGVHAFLAAAGHYAPWEQIWQGKANAPTIFSDRYLLCPSAHKRLEETSSVRKL
jgi:uncharacterized membrane protein YfhO